MANTPTHPIYPNDGKQPKNYTGGKPVRVQLRPLHCKVSPMTLKNLYKLAKVAGYDDCIGKVIDNLVTEHMIALRQEKNNG